MKNIIKKDCFTKSIDLHIHTTASDGVDSPEKIVQNAIECKMAAIAITDHDTVVGVRTVLEEKNITDIEIIPGAEFTVKSKPIMHIIGLFIDVENKFLGNELCRLNNRRMRLITKAFKKVRDYGVNVTPQQILTDEKVVTIFNLKKYLASKNLLKEELDIILTEIIDEWKDTLPVPEKCISMIHNYGGLSFLAHPKLLNFNDSELMQILVKLKRVGLDGIEVIHPSHTPEDQKKYMKVAKQIGLLCSGGSDYHSSSDHYSAMRNDIYVPYFFLEEIKQRIVEKENDQ